MQQSTDIASDAPRLAPGPDPLEVLNTWHADAVRRADPTPDAMTLATATPDGRPSARIVLFKGIVRGAVFFVTNYRSRKARELEANPHAALVMHYGALERQVRVEGRVERASAAESDAYFHSRPRGSQLGAWASPQSATITSRAELDALSSGVQARFADHDVERPEFWGGYLVFPEAVELWLGRPDRLHDRFRYVRAASGEGWSIERLAP
ncbi:MAG TPA: pyridoxamine 5'-phosphate oxidase [Polyangiaceae bacterium]|nr:pyridoxamine 5'-phosphate oxidase [Polyangiaceae bacterium]